MWCALRRRPCGRWRTGLAGRWRRGFSARGVCCMGARGGAGAWGARADGIGGPMAEAFQRAVDLLYGCAGRVVVTGMGKSGLIARKIAATLSSTGTPSLYLHPVEALHGDLGMVVRGDVVLALSASGETEEI